MTQLHTKMLQELRRRNYSPRTAKTYVRIVGEFAVYFHKPPDKLGPEQIRQYQAHLFETKKLSPATLTFERAVSRKSRPFSRRLAFLRC